MTQPLVRSVGPFLLRLCLRRRPSTRSCWLMQYRKRALRSGSTWRQALVQPAEWTQSLWIPGQAKKPEKWELASAWTLKASE